MKKDVIFFWLPKTAGTSIYQILNKYNCPKLKKPELFANFNNRGLVTFGHVDVNYLLKHNIVEGSYFNRAFKFCIVRNPWDRVVSLYHYLNYDEKMPFGEFCEAIRRVPPIGPYNKKGLSQANPLTDWVTDKKGNLLVDFVGKFENLDQDIAEVFKIIGVEEKLGHHNKTIHKPYQEYYSDKTKNLVGNIYKRDIEMFEYDF